MKLDGTGIKSFRVDAPVRNDEEEPSEKVLDEITALEKERKAIEELRALIAAEKKEGWEVRT